MMQGKPRLWLMRDNGGIVRAVDEAEAREVYALALHAHMLPQAREGWPCRPLEYFRDHAKEADIIPLDPEGPSEVLFEQGSYGPSDYWFGSLADPMP